MLTTNALELNETSLEVVGTLPRAEWVHVVRILVPRAHSCPWWIGDLLVFGQTEFEVTEDEFQLIGSRTPYAESGPTVYVTSGTIIPSEDEAASGLVEPARGEMLIESRGKRAILLSTGRIALTLN